MLILSFLRKYGQGIPSYNKILHKAQLNMGVDLEPGTVSALIDCIKLGKNPIL